MADANGNRQLYATVAAIVLGGAGAAGWLKPADNSATAKSYDTMSGALRDVEDRCDERVDRLEDRQQGFERWVADQLHEIDRDLLPEHRPPDRPEPHHYEPPPRPAAPPPKPKAASKLPTSEELFE